MIRKEERTQKYLKILKKNPLLYSPLWEEEISDRAKEAAASCVLAPAMTAFVMWTLARAGRLGIKRLYFLARDGYLMYHTARALCREMNLSIECRYLYCSRYSLRLPLYHLDMDQALSYICRGGIDVTPQRLMKRAGLSMDEGRRIWEQLHLPYEMEETIPYRRLSAVRECLKTSPFFLSLVKKRSREGLPFLKGYLRQEGLLDHIHCAVVDSGWVGSMQKLLNAAVALLEKKERIPGFYWGLYQLPKGVDEKEYHCYFFSPKGSIRTKVYFNNCFFEAVFTAPHGMTLGYSFDKKYVPCLGEVSEGQTAFVTDLRKTIETYAVHIGRNINLGEMEREAQRARPVVRRLLRLLMSHPTYEEALSFGSIRFSDDVTEGTAFPLARPMSQRELMENHGVYKLLNLAGKREGTVKESPWYEGSAALGNSQVSRHLRQYRLYQYLRFWIQYLKGST